MLVYAVRHAESLANARQDASLNGQLSPLGLQQVEALRTRFSRIPLAAVYSSPFDRCLQTAIPLARDQSLRIELRSELCEYHAAVNGSAELNLPEAAEIARRNDGVVSVAGNHGGWPTLSEKFEEVIARTRGFGAYLKKRWGDQDVAVLIVSHGSPIARLIDGWLTDVPGPSFRFIIDNAAIAALRYHSGVSSLVCLNEMSHLAGLSVPQGSNMLADGSIRLRPFTNYW